MSPHHTIVANLETHEQDQVIRDGRRLDSSTDVFHIAETIHLASFKQPVLLFVYQGKVSWKQNLHVTRALEKMTTTGKLSKSKYRGIGISNFQESAAPNALIRAILRMVTKRSKMLLLLDESGGMRKLWGFRNGRSNIYVLDQKRRLRWRSSGPLTKRRARQLLRLVRRLVRQSP